jgi:hypothetical protein
MRLPGATVLCPECQGTYYMNAKQCPWCDAPRSRFAIAEFHLWDPSLGEGSRSSRSRPGIGTGRSVAAALAITDGETKVITRRHVNGHAGREGQRPVIALKLEGSRVHGSALDGAADRLYVAHRGAGPLDVGPRPSSRSCWSRITPLGVCSLGSIDTLHRVVSFTRAGKRVPNEGT